MTYFINFILLALYTGGIFMAGMLVGQLYALYVLVYTGAVFMAGLWFGQRWERSWEARRESQEDLSQSQLHERELERGSDAAVTLKNP